MSYILLLKDVNNFFRLQPIYINRVILQLLNENTKLKYKTMETVKYETE